MYFDPEKPRVVYAGVQITRQTILSWEMRLKSCMGV